MSDRGGECKGRPDYMKVFLDGGNLTSSKGRRVDGGTSHWFAVGVE